MMAELKKLDISPDNIEGVEQYTDLSIDEIITQALGGIDRKLAGMISQDMTEMYNFQNVTYLLVLLYYQKI